MSHLEGAYEQVGRRLDSLDSHLDRLSERIDHFATSMNARIDVLGARIDALGARLDAKIDERFTWTVGIIVGTWAGTIATMIALFVHR
jgi:tetrahydromethanopterin S-methyltransferase subunit G